MYTNQSGLSSTALGGNACTTQYLQGVFLRVGRRVPRVDLILAELDAGWVGTGSHGGSAGSTCCGGGSRSWL